MSIRPTGPCPSKIMIVGEAPFDQDVRAGVPFAGSAGAELTKMLHEAGILRGACFTTYAYRSLAPANDLSKIIVEKKKDVDPLKHVAFRDKFVLPGLVSDTELLRKEIFLCRPNIIIALGTLPTWLLTGQWGVKSWRGSLLQCDLDTGLDYQPKVIPAYPPGHINKNWSDRPIAVHDFRRAAKEAQSPLLVEMQFDLLVRPQFEQLMTLLSGIEADLDAQVHRSLAVDIETKRGHIDCIGLAWSKHAAVCIPFMSRNTHSGHYFQEWEEIAVVQALRRILTHPNCHVIGQNFAYDAQYIHRWWGFVPNLTWDTMLGHHAMFSNSRKSLDFLASLYCEQYVYWKDENQEANEKVPEEQRWVYNCKDCCYTFEVAEAEQAAVAKLTAGGWSKLPEVVAFQQAMFFPVLETMVRGIAVDAAAKKRFSDELLAAIALRQQRLEVIAGQPINIRSPAQMKRFFYEDLAQKPVYKRKPGAAPTLSCDDESLRKVAAKEPLLRPVVQLISDLRSLGVFHSTFISAQADIDGRMRCSFNVGGTETYRFSSSTNAFGTGLNLQNIPSGGDGTDFTLPNVRSLFIPDPDHTFFDIDLSSADLRIVVWEADEPEMKAMLREGLDPYTEIAKEFYHDPSITKKDKRRQTFKSFAHGCLTAGHEVLTPQGWVPIEQYDETQPLMVWDSSSWAAKFEQPARMVRDLGVHFVTITGQSYECEVTHDHRIPYTTDRALQVAAASDLPSSARLPMCGFLDGPEQVSPIEARLLAAFQADGSVDQYGNVRFHFHRQRKINRLRQLLLAYCDWDFAENATHFYIPRRAAAFAQWGKQAGPYLLNWSAAALDAFLDELQYWDGSATGTVLCHVSTVDKPHADWLQTIAKLRGFGSQVALQREESDTRQTLWRVSLNKRKYFNLATGTKTDVYETAPRAVYCPQTSTGFFFVRRNGKIFVTGNTNYLGTAKGLAERLGLSVADAERTQHWYFSRFPKIKKWQDDIKAQVTGRRYVENVFGYRCYFLDRIEGTIFNQAVAWIPQSTVGCLINRGYSNIYRNLREVQVLLQVHDSLAGQFPTSMAETMVPKIIEACSVTLPYADPLVIPVGINTSTVSWGGCK